MEWWQSVLLGLIEGVTEYLPVSSTGHLILAQRAFGIPESVAADAYAVCIQAGAILAVLLLFARRVGHMLKGLVGKDPEGLRLVVAILAAFLPAAVIGLLVGGRVKEALFNLPAITAAWAVGGVAILWTDQWRARRQDAGKPLEGLDWRRALVIGLMQCLAFWPGTSRSLVTILGGLVVGLSLSAAVEFSFLLGVVTLLAATAKDLKDHGGLLIDTFGADQLVLGLVIGGVSAAVAVRWMVGWLNRHGMGIFGWYRLGLALVVGVLLSIGLL